MLALRKNGWGYAELGRKFGVDHTSIMFQCNKHEVRVLENKKEDKEDKEVMKEDYKKRRSTAMAKSPLQDVPRLENARRLNLGKRSYEDYVQAEEKRTRKAGCEENSKIPVNS